MRDTNYNDTTKSSTAVSKSLIDLKTEMKFLNWHKLANESALQAALHRTKRLRNMEKKQKDEIDERFNKDNSKRLERRDNDSQEQERKKIMEEEEEKAKPLQIEEGYINKIQQEDKQIKVKSIKEIQHLIQYIQQMKQKIQEREIRNFKKQEMQNIRNFMKQERLEYQTKTSKLQRNRNCGAISFLSKIPKKLKNNVSSLFPKSNLGNVLSSLEKIVELEHRIRELEANKKKKKSSSSSEIVLSQKNKKNNNMKLIFSKQKTMSLPSIPSRMYHSVKMITNGVSLSPSSSANNMNGSIRKRNSTEQSSFNRKLSNVNSKFQEAKHFLTLRAQERKLLHEKQLKPSFRQQRQINNAEKENIPRSLNSKIRVSNTIKTNRNSSLFRLNKTSSHSGNLQALRALKQNHFKRKDAIKKQTATLLTNSFNKQRRIKATISSTQQRQRQQQQQKEDTKTKQLRMYNKASIKRKTTTKKKTSFHLPNIKGNSISSSSSTIKLLPATNKSCFNKRVLIDKTTKHI